MSTQQVHLGFSDIVVPTGVHIVYPYQSEDERREALVSFVCEGLRNGDKCITIVPEYTQNYWRKAIALRGVDIAGIPDESFRPVPATDLCKPTSAETAHAAAELISECVERSHADSGRVTRICVGLGFLMQHREAAMAMLEGDDALNRTAPDSPTVILCTIGACDVYPQLLDIYANRHPFVTDGKTVWVNDDYVHPDRAVEHSPEAMLDAASAAEPATRPFASLDFHGCVPTIRPAEELDIYTCTYLEEMANRVIDCGHRKLLLDMSGTEYVDAASISTILRISLRLRELGGSLAICDPQYDTRRIFSLIGFTEILPVRTDLDGAASCLSVE